MPRWREIVQVDAFARVPFTGNSAAVLLDTAGLDPVVMQRLAREMNVSETAFVLPSSQADLQLRWFTPTVEVPLCGHATVAACHALAERGHLVIPGQYTIETASGILAVELQASETSACKVWLDIPVPEFEPLDLQIVALAAALGLDEADIRSDIPPTRGGEYGYIGCHNLANLLAIKPNMNDVRFLCQSHQLTALTLYCLEGLDAESAVHVRFFGPVIGIDEDPVTGSAQGPLGALLVGVGVIAQADGSNVVHYRAEQGDAMGRPGRVEVAVEFDQEAQVMSSRIGGEALTILRGHVLA
ncbi:PhzF family phenazine biosynthesis protein [Herpetosiphon llansteffanensis]|uniref:PhzF family phenazine biosynthesis protein n=1 Tax=Herpetosiphon llansteffanensis TaxID=2094568 RepID=UPI000D7D0A7F|nr:PhzF family phenazine biosynthesis protein [Herpetosiphon llansteffanensis]